MRISAINILKALALVLPGLFTPQVNLSAQFNHQLQFLQFDMVDGLANNHINDMIMDDQGYLWMAHDNMLSRFDGHSSLVFSESKTDLFHLPAKDFLYITKDSNGQLWISTEGYGLIRLDPVTFEYSHFTHDEKDSTTIPTDFVQEVTQIQDDEYLIGTIQQGILRYTPSTNTFEQILPCTDQDLLEEKQHVPNSTRSFIQDPFDSLTYWTITGTGFLEANFVKKSFTYHSIESNGLFAIRDFILLKGKIYGSTWIEGLVELDLKTRSITSHYCPNTPGLPKSCRGGPAITVLDDSTLMMASGTGTYLFDITTNAFEWYDSRSLRNRMPQVPSGYYRDEYNHLWVHTYGDGIYILPKHHQPFQKYKLEGHMTGVIAKDNQIYISNYYEEFIVVDLGRDSLLRIETPYQIHQNDNYLRNVGLDKQGRVYALDGAGVWRYDEKSKTLAEFLKPNQRALITQSGYYWNMHFEDDDILWLGSQGSGLLQVDMNADEVVAYNSESSDKPLIRDYALAIILKDTSNRLWLTADQGISYLDLDTKEFHLPTWPLRDTTGEIFFDKYLRGTLDQNGNIWFAQELNRMARVEVVDGQSRMFPVKTSNVPAETVRAMLTDKNGDIWLASENGIARYRIKADTMEYFGQAYGIGYTNSLSMDDSGFIFASTGDGILRFHPDSVSAAAPPVKTLISSFKVFDQPYARKQNDSVINLSFKQNFFAFEYAALTFDSKSPIEYQYMLQGLDKEWIDAGDRTYAAYTNLDGGDYIFKVRARRAHEPWPQSVRSMAIHITTPFWKTIWFYTTIAALLFILIWSIFKYRENEIKLRAQLLTEFNQQLAEVEMKALRAQMNPHFLFNSLNAIKFFIQKNEKEKAEDYLNDFAKLIRLVLNNSSKKQINLADELSALELYIRIEKMRFDNKFDYTIDVAEDVPIQILQIPPMIFQPYVENAIWHGLMHKTDGKGQLIVSLKTEDQKTICTIEDNGIGRQKAYELKSKSAEKKKSMGMKITQSRMDLSSQNSNLSFNVKVYDLSNERGKGTGTKVVIQLTPQSN